LNIVLTQTPIQNLLSLSRLLPKLRALGIQNVSDLEKFTAEPAGDTGALSGADLEMIEGALTAYAAEQEFARTFKWELLAYAPEVQAEFSVRALDVFESRFSNTRLIYLSISTRTLRALEQAGLHTVGDVLRTQSKLLEHRNLGERSVGELFRIIGQFARVYRYVIGNLWSVTERRLTPPGLVKAILGPLNEREKEVIRKRYGLDGVELTLRETGEALGISRERARQIQNRTMEKLREGSSLALIHDWLELQLPHLIHRALVRHGGIASTDELSRAVSSTEFSLGLIADILDMELTELIRASKKAVTLAADLWAISDAVADLARDAQAAWKKAGLPATPDEPTLDEVEAARSAFATGVAEAGSLPPSNQFLGLVARHLGALN
jgi:hypothetical protein